MLRLATPDDAGSIRDIYAPFIEKTVITFEYGLPSVKEMEDRMRKILVQLPWLVYEQDGIITGYAYASKHRDRIAYQWSADASVYLHPDFQGRGIARLLYSTLFDLLRKLGYYNVYAGITMPNARSERLHLSMGFKSVGIYEKVGYKFGDWHDVQWYSLTLKEHNLHPQPPIPITQFQSDQT